MKTRKKAFSLSVSLVIKSERHVELVEHGLINCYILDRASSALIKCNNLVGKKAKDDRKGVYIVKVIEL